MSYWPVPDCYCIWRPCWPSLPSIMYWWQIFSGVWHRVFASWRNYQTRQSSLRFLCRWCPAVSVAPSWCCNHSIRAVKKPNQSTVMDKHEIADGDVSWLSGVNLIFWSLQCLTEQLLSKAITLWQPDLDYPHYSTHTGKIKSFACLCNIATFLWNIHWFIQPFSCILV